ncbi:transposase [Desulfobulbus rhabdoformis]|nr:transposase [Desulfobulbus rhabdoformis]
MIGKKSIVADTNSEVTFRYRDSVTGTMQKRTLKGEEFLHFLLQHVLPNGFRRLREYGFLHGNTKEICSWSSWLCTSLSGRSHLAPDQRLHVRTAINRCALLCYRNDYRTGASDVYGKRLVRHSLQVAA